LIPLQKVHLRNHSLHAKRKKGKKSLVINENHIVRITAFSYNFRSNDAETNGSEATLIYFKTTDIRKVIWQTSQMYYIIEDTLTEEEIRILT